jgi:hypothetical protein
VLVFEGKELLKRETPKAKIPRPAVARCERVNIEIEDPRSLIRLGRIDIRDSIMMSPWQQDRKAFSAEMTSLGFCRKNGMNGTENT